MLPERRNLALALVVLFIVFVVPTFFIVGSVAEFLGFVAVVFLLSFDLSFIKDTACVAYYYFNPLKIVDGRYGMSGAWIGAEPIGYIVVSWISAHLCSFLNNSYVCVNNV
jgi:hypothetical protein